MSSRKLEKYFSITVLGKQKFNKNFFYCSAPYISSNLKKFLNFLKSFDIVIFREEHHKFLQHGVFAIKKIFFFFFFKFFKHINIFFNKIYILYNQNIVDYKLLLEEKWFQKPTTFLNYFFKHINIFFFKYYYFLLNLIVLQNIFALTLIFQVLLFSFKLNFVKIINNKC